MLLKFSKMHGLGNDFMVVDCINQKVEFTTDLIQRLGDRNFGVGFDQLLLVEKPAREGLDFYYRIFNRDGSEVQMCGNGARCFARFVKEHKLSDKNTLHVSTVSGEIVLTIEDDGEVVVNMGVPTTEPSRIPLKAAQESAVYTVDLTKELGAEFGGVIEFGSVSMGNPHMTTWVKSTKDCFIEKQGPILESHPLFPERVNVGFMEFLNKNEVNLRVYERGCGETMACGSGACAAAVVGMIQGKLDSKVKVNLPGGSLTISWQGAGSPVMMKGPATLVFDGVIDLERF